MVKIAINGFGRIGRMLLRAGLDVPDVEFVGINDIGDIKNMAYLFRYDSIQPRFEGTVEAKEHSLVINEKEIPVFAEKDPKNLPWKQLDVDVVFEATGLFTKKSDAMLHIQAGAKKVLISAPWKGSDWVKTIIKGVNEHTLVSEDTVISNGSCTTNCLAPMIKVLNDNFVVKRAYFTTIHAMTADQRIVDAPHSDFRRGRTAAVNITPTSSGAQKAVAEAIPSLKGKLEGFAMRVPVATGSVTDLTCELGKEVTVEEINNLFKNVAGHHLKDVLQYTEDEIVSSDIIHNPHSCIFDAKLTQVLDKNFVKVIGWYDNEWGFSNRMIEVAKLMIK